MDVTASSILKIFLVVLVLLVVINGILFVAAWYFIHRVVVRHTPAANFTPEEFGLNVEEHFFNTEDGLKLEAYYIQAPNAGKVIILVHGASDESGKNFMLPYADFLYDAGYSTFLISLRNYAGSEGEKTSFGTVEWKDVVAAYNYVKNLEGNENKEIGLMGLSMGGAAILVAAGEEGVGDFIISSVPYKTVASGISWRGKNILYLPQKLLYPYVKLVLEIELDDDYEKYQPETVIEKIDVPVLLITGENDKIINPQDAKDLFEMGGENFSLWVSETAGHDVLRTDPDNFKREVLEYLANLD